MPAISSQANLEGACAKALNPHRKSCLHHEAIEKLAATGCNDQRPNQFSALSFCPLTENTAYIGVSKLKLDLRNVLIKNR
jgi:hypothetical protein